MDYQWRFEAVWEFREVFLQGALITVQLSLLAIVFAVLLGGALGIVRALQVRVLSPAVVVYVELVRNTPLLVQIFWFFYCLPIVVGANIPAFWSAAITLSIHFSAYIAEITRSGISSIDRGQWDAARMAGFSPLQTLRHVILPQAIRRVIPPMVNCFADIVKLSSLASVIGVYDLLHSINNVIMQSFRPLELYTMVAVVYFVIIYPLSLLASRLERRMMRGAAQ